MPFLRGIVRLEDAYLIFPTYLKSSGGRLVSVRKKYSLNNLLFFVFKNVLMLVFMKLYCSTDARNGLRHFDGRHFLI